jgi:hypothetical protein
LFERRRPGLEGLNDGVGVSAAPEQAISNEQAVGVRLRLLQPVKAAQHKVHSGERIVAFAPALCGPMKVMQATDRGPAQVGRSQERAKSPLGRIYGDVPGRISGARQDCPRAKHEAFVREAHKRVDGDQPAARKPERVQFVREHAFPSG